MRLVSIGVFVDEERLKMRGIGIYASDRADRPGGRYDKAGGICRKLLFGLI